MSPRKPAPHPWTAATMGRKGGKAKSQAKAEGASAGGVARAAQRRAENPLWGLRETSPGRWRVVVRGVYRGTFDQAKALRVRDEAAGS